MSNNSKSVLANDTAVVPETETLDTLKVPPRAIGAKLRVARTPSPAGRLSPASENPRAIPVSALYDISGKSDKTPVSSTPSVSN